ncbi:MAG TPA: gluconate 2-dehydrogenase subunit 3 family protein [Terriglobales bacterium]|nr:gluconate 2-dehydrogenase subunit 3 family protein [Terriglobales bacterium]
MAGQNVERREILRMLSLAAAAATFPGFSKWSFACGAIGEELAPSKPAVYQPVFFTAAEYALVERLAAIIIPTDETPGADQAGVAEFIDVMTARDPDLQHQLRAGGQWLDAHSQKLEGKPFLGLSSDRQVSLLETLAYREKFRAGEESGRNYFALMREYTIMGFYTSEVGLKELDFPGLRFYAESPACPHRDDPEHRHLPPPQF